MPCVELPGSLQKKYCGSLTKVACIYGYILIVLFNRIYMCVHHICVCTYIIPNWFQFIIIWDEANFIKENMSWKHTNNGIVDIETWQLWEKLNSLTCFKKKHSAV